MYKKEGRRREIPEDFHTTVSKSFKLKKIADKNDKPKTNLDRYLIQGYVKDFAARLVSS